MAVKAVPTKMPMTGLEKVVSRLIKAGLSLSGATEPLMACMPYISTEKPSIISPTWCFCWLLVNMRSRIPMIAMTAESVDVLSREIQPEPLIDDRQMIQPVMLVPIRAPSITVTACSSFIMPELTKPTTMMDVADEDWMTAVTPAPSSTPFSGVLDRRYKTSSSWLPATFFRPSPISVMPNRNRATPPSSEMMSASCKKIPPMVSRLQ